MQISLQFRCRNISLATSALAVLGIWCWECLASWRLMRYSCFAVLERYLFGSLYLLQCHLLLGPLPRSVLRCQLPAPCLAALASALQANYK